MRIRSVVTALALTAGALVTSTLGASAASPNSISQLESGYFSSLWQPASCSVGYGTALVVIADVTGPYFDEHPNTFIDTVTARISLSKGGAKVATLVATGEIGPEQEGQRVLSLSAEDCTTAKKLRAAGLGLAATTYSVKIDSASFTDGGGVKRNLNAGKAKNVVSKRTVRAIATSRAISGGSYVWKGKLQLLAKSGASYSWAAAGKNLSLFRIDGNCMFGTLKTTTGGRFTITVPKSIGRTLFFGSLETATLADSYGTYAKIVDGKVRNGANPGALC